MNGERLTNTTINALMYPPVLLRIYRALTFPAIVMTRQDLGERYYRNAIPGRLLFYFCGLIPMPLFIGGAIGFLVACATSLVALVWFVVCDRQCRRAIRDRRQTGEFVHSFSMGRPRFGMPNDEQTNVMVLPRRVFLLAVCLMPLSASIAAYLGFSAMGMYAEGAWRRHLAREAALDARDANAGFFSVAAKEAEDVGSAGRGSSEAELANPLAGFEDVLANPDTK